MGLGVCSRCHSLVGNWVKRKKIVKKTCDRCKALIEGQGEPLGCRLGAKMDVHKGIPLAPCPKPKTYMGLILILNRDAK